jgi:hypothetical protein
MMKCGKTLFVDLTFIYILKYSLILSQVFLMYYPRNTNMVRCKEKFELDTWKEFLIQLNRFLYNLLLSFVQINI